MSSKDSEDAIAKALDERSGEAAVTSGVSQGVTAPELQALLEAADLAWVSEQTAPPLEEDPLAAMLGLVPDPSTELDGKVLGSARKRAGLTVSALASHLNQRGWEVTSKDLFSWESGRNLPRIPALINALAEETGADADRLRRAVGEDPERKRLAAIVNSSAFTDLARRWARIQGTTLALATSALESRMLVAVHRGGAPETDVMLDSLEAMISSVEESQRQ